MIDLETIATSTKSFVEAGHRIFQIYRFADSEDAHCDRLLKWADPPVGASILDVGCGVGAQADYWLAARPDLSITGINLSTAQLAYASIPCCHGDMEQLPYSDGSFDMVTYCFSIGHADVSTTLLEAYRVLRPGGTIFIYDMARVAGDNQSLHEMAYEVNPRLWMDARLSYAGFRQDWYMEPYDSGSYGRSLFGPAFDEVFYGVIPAIWRWVKP